MVIRYHYDPQPGASLPVHSRTSKLYIFMQVFRE